MPAAVDLEVARLRAVLRDVVALAALPLAWVGREPLAVVDGLADTLTGLLNLDFVSVRLCDPRTSQAVQSTRGDAWKSFPEWLETHLAKAGRLIGTEIVPDVDGRGFCRGVVIPVALDAEAGVIAAACDRSDYPTETDLLLLRLAANQASIAFQRACLIVERDRAEHQLRTARDKLEATVAEQTAEQSALRRVATLVARGTPQVEVFAAVTEEVGRLFSVDFSNLSRYEPDGTITLVAVWARTGDQYSPIRGLPLGGHNLATMVFETGRPARIDGYQRAPGEEGKIARGATRAGLRCSVAAPITVDGRLWGFIALGSTADAGLVGDTEARLANFTELVATAIANAQSRAELTESRARIVAAADETRRRIERDLHDGVQQQLVTLGLKLRSLASTIPAELERVHNDLGGVVSGLENVMQELRELSRGIHPAVLSRGGLEPALKTLARRAPMPVEVHVQLPARPPERIEVAAYYVVAEALTNVAKHAHASSVSVEVEPVSGGVQVSVADDGVGGADPAHGSGLVGLRDRVEALDATMTLISPAGAGTVIVVCFPVLSE